MTFSWTALLPLAFSTILLLIEIYLRILNRQRHRSPYLSHRWYLIVNSMLWGSCILLSGLVVGKRIAHISVASFQMVWMQAAVLTVGIALL